MKVMGIDLGTRKAAYAVWEEMGGEWNLVEADAYESNAPMRQTQLMDVSDWVYEVVKYSGVDYVFIEDTLVGNNVKYSIQLAQVMGACLANLALLEAEQMLGVYLVNNKTWKKDVLGNGNAGKDLVRSWVKTKHDAYAALCGEDQDRYDAACIAYYGTLISDRSEVFA